MEKSFSCDEHTIQNQFDRLCKMALRGERIDYIRHVAYRQKHEKLFSELSPHEMQQLSSSDEYSVEKHNFQVLGHDVKVCNSLIAEALEALTKRKRDVILLSFFFEMSDADIARELNLVRSTIQEHRVNSLELLKQFMEGRNGEQTQEG